MCILTRELKRLQIVNVVLNQDPNSCVLRSGLLIEKEKDMEPNPHYINMLINVGIFALLVYVAINV